MDEPRFNQHVGIEIETMEEGRASARLDAGPRHLNGQGWVHGGALAALLDTALGCAVISTLEAGWGMATTSLAVQFLRGSQGGELRAQGRVVRRGGAVAFAAGEILDRHGRTVATAQGTWSLRPPAAEEKGSRMEPYVVLRGRGERIAVGKILAVGRNYAAHAAEMGNAPGAPPVVFLKPPSALIHDGGTVRIPAGLGEVHHEVEMVVVMGEGGRAIPENRALEHVLGYAVGLDMTLRDLQATAKSRGEPWALAKGFDTSAPVSFVAPRDEVGDGSGLELSLDVNGQRRQQSTTSLMIHGVASLVARASQLITLERGDLIFTGTPAGVGPVEAGDRLEARLERVGTLRVTVGRAEPSAD